jgi:DNA-directed RNA polymerase specialized sigma24 family protein
MQRYRFWIHSRNAAGQPLEPSIIQAAEESIPMLVRYRRDEIGCESTINGLLQSVVERVSMAHRRKPIRKPAAYLHSAYRHVVDKFLERQNRFVSIDPGVCDAVAVRAAKSWEDDIHRRLVLEKVAKAMDPETRQIAIWRSVGYSTKDIGGFLSCDPRLVTVRYRRGVQRALRKVLERPERPSEIRTLRAFWCL